eukprot:437403_1
MEVEPSISPIKFSPPPDLGISEIQLLDFSLTLNVINDAVQNIDINNGYTSLSAQPIQSSLAANYNTNDINIERLSLSQISNTSNSNINHISESEKEHKKQPQHYKQKSIMENTNNECDIKNDNDIYDNNAIICSEESEQNEAICTSLPINKICGNLVVDSALEFITHEKSDKKYKHTPSVYKKRTLIASNYDLSKFKVESDESLEEYLHQIVAFVVENDEYNIAPQITANGNIDYKGKMIVILSY